MADISGTVTAVFRAQGSHTYYSFHHKERDCINHISMDLTLTVRYVRAGMNETIAATIQGSRTKTSEAPAYGWDPKVYHYSTGFWYVPSRHDVITETYSGSSMQKFTYPSHLSKFYWSKEQKLACFRIGLGEMAAPGFFVPVKIHTEQDLGTDDSHDRSSWDSESQLMALIPSGATSGTRFASLVNNHDTMMKEMLGGWIETSSAQGTSSGSFTVPMFLDGMAWRTEGLYKESGRDPRKRSDSSEEDLVWPGSVQVTWALGNKLPQGRMTIAPDDKAEYDQWIPAPVDDTRFGLGDYVGFTARILPKEEGKPAPLGKIHFWLCDMSREKGICSNNPLDGGTEDDLRFVPGAGLIIDPANPLHAYTEKACTQATVMIEATDTGAYGRLQATCDELGLVAEDDRTKLQWISIPLDDNHNHAADAWEKSLGIYGNNYLPTDDDDDQPANQRRKGDGYTFYEEYRGFMTLDKFVRTDPRKKDLFVHDPDGLFKKWYAPYNPAQLELHYIDLTMMKYNGAARDPENRWVNCNSSEDKWYARQYGMFVKNWPVMEDGGSTVVGEASWHVLSDKLNEVTDFYDDFKQPLKRFYMIKISQAAIEKLIRTGVQDPNVRQDAFQKMMTVAVIHEIGHGIGIHHHADGMHETDESVYNGVFACAMRYNTEMENKKPELMKWQTKYCKKGETWQRAVTKTDANGNTTTTFQAARHTTVSGRSMSSRIREGARWD